MISKRDVLILCACLVMSMVVSVAVGGLRSLIGPDNHNEPEPVCWSSSEDSDIVGCDYDDGAWRREDGQ